MNFKKAKKKRTLFKFHMGFVLEGFFPTNWMWWLCYSIHLTTWLTKSAWVPVWELSAEDSASWRFVLPPNSCGASFVLFGGPVAPALFRAFTPVSLTSHSQGYSSQVINYVEGGEAWDQRKKDQSGTHFALVLSHNQSRSFMRNSKEQTCCLEADSLM